jgi:hypothetical protein
VNKRAASPSYKRQRMMTAHYAQMRNREMCDKCTELDDKIEHYRRIASSINDQFTVDRIKVLIAELEAQKAALHPEQK